MNIDDTLLLASKSYTEDIAQRALFSNIPFVGSAIDNLFTSKWSNYYADRLQVFQECVKAEFDDIDETKIDHDFLQSEAFFDLIITLIENSIKTRHTEKVQLFSKLLKCQCNLSFETKYQPDEFTFIINEFNPRDILIIKAIEQLNIQFRREKTSSDKPDEINDFITTKKISQLDPFTDTEIGFSLSKLAKLGMLSEYYPGNVFGMTGGGDYKTTDSYDEILSILNS